MYNLWSCLAFIAKSETVNLYRNGYSKTNLLLRFHQENCTLRSFHWLSMFDLTKGATNDL